MVEDKGVVKMVSTLTLQQRALVVTRAYAAAVAIERVLAEENAIKTHGLSNGQFVMLARAAKELGEVLP